MKKEFIRKYKIDAIKHYKVFPERCDYCRGFFYHIYKIKPSVKTHQFDNLILCEACFKKVFNLDEDEITQLAEESTD